ncbi:MAG: right-handed parallel beta-helix repeat-containing protein, partial [Anaerolineae bacterium]|nr:right-handed parallel beta-helix repeat-containing protein [Anaerolineae bacterium]
MGKRYVVFGAIVLAAVVGLVGLARWTSNEDDTQLDSTPAPMVREGLREVFVAPTGDDTQEGTIDHPLATIGRAANAVATRGTIYLRGGVYDQAVDNILPDHVTLQAYNGEAVILRPTAGNFVVLIAGDTKSHIVIEDLVLDGSNIGLDTVKVTAGAHDITFVDCEIMNAKSPDANFNHGVLISSRAYNVTLTRCSVHDNGRDQFSHGIYCAGVAGIVIAESHIYHNAGHGIHCAGNNDRAAYTIRRNFIYSNGDYGIGAYYGTATIVNNVVRRHQVANIRVGYALMGTALWHNTLLQDNMTVNGVRVVTITRANAVIDIANNVIVDSTGPGIQLRGSNHAFGVLVQVRTNLMTNNRMGNLVADTGSNTLFIEVGTL